MVCTLFTYALHRALMQCVRRRLGFAESVRACALNRSGRAHHFDDLRFLASSFLLSHDILNEDDSSKKGTHTYTSHRPDFNHGGFIHNPTSMLLEKSHTRSFFFLRSHGHAHRALSAAFGGTLDFHYKYVFFFLN